LTHVITRSCCNDASCIAVCPVNCIHPTPEDPDFLTAEMLYIDPDSCIDCGACIPECPVDAIASDDMLRPEQERFLGINAGYFVDREVSWAPVAVRRSRQFSLREPLTIAVVGAGAAGHFLAKELLRSENLVVDLYDRLPTPYGLVRSGVAPDHANTKQIQSVFREVAASPRCSYVLNVEVGRDVTHEELLAHYSAVVYAHGAMQGRQLDIPGADLGNVITAAELVSWYNGHPEGADLQVDLSHERAVVIGNGNVALDVARILLGTEDALRETDIADHSVEAIANSAIREVVILGRRSVAHAAYTNAEFIALLEHDGIDVVVDAADLMLDAQTAQALEQGSLESTTAAKINLAREATELHPSADRRIVFRYLTSPTRLTANGDARTVILARNEMRDHRLIQTDQESSLEAGLFIAAIGYQPQPVDGVPFDATAGIVPNIDGRATQEGRNAVLERVYVTGWAKRGATGGIGRNRQCALETAGRLLDDVETGAVKPNGAGREGLLRQFHTRGVQVVDQDGWARIDATELSAGDSVGRPRVKLVGHDDLLRAAAGPFDAHTSSSR